jgi:hypothetical protein
VRSGKAPIQLRARICARVFFPMRLRLMNRCIHMLSVTERAVYGASMSAVPQLSLNSKIVGLLTLKRPEGRAPTSRQLVDALLMKADE